MKQFLQLGILLLILIIFQPIFPWCRSLASAQVHPEDCLKKCGDVEIPYPFGTTEACSLNSNFTLNCKQSDSGPPSLYLGTGSEHKVINIFLNGSLRIYTTVAKACFNKDGSPSTPEGDSTVGLILGSFSVSNKHNKFTAVGCDTIGAIAMGETSTGCLSQCAGNTSIAYDGSCSGIGCCEITIPKNHRGYGMAVVSLANHTNVWDYNPCSYIFVAENFTFSEGDLENLKDKTQMETILDWAIGSSSCEDVTNSPEFACRENSQCVNSTNGPGYGCICKEGYRGNPYVSHGCQDIDECTDTETHDPCGGNVCVNNIGNYTCTCNDGYVGLARRDGKGCEKMLKTKLPLIEITVGIAVGLAAFLIVGSWLFWGYNKRKHLLLRQKFFEQNGGLMLRRELAGKEGYTETAKIFTANELKQATNNFDESRIIGRGGFGTVYKGILEDSKVIAIKKSKVMDQDQIEQFINEVVVLSQINHRNVVRLLGCCLETEVPLLVYEYVSNGTLHEHIHEKKNPSGVLSWENRLRIAAEVAGVLAYLHSEASIPIVHRDIKCTNILLDDNCTAKVSDFGASRLVPIDQDTLSTMVQGTIGYLDPEYLHTSQLTEKSDVYSFGVVLVELMTGKKALAFDRPEEERCLAMLFILSMKNDKLFYAIEDGLANDANKKQIQEAANLALACLRVLGDERPSMRKVASELHGLLLTGTHPWIDATTSSKENEHENEHLLGFQLRDGYGPSDATSCNTTACYDSITAHVVLSVGDGR